MKIQNINSTSFNGYLNVKVLNKNIDTKKVSEIYHNDSETIFRLFSGERICIPHFKKFNPDFQEEIIKSFKEANKSDSLIIELKEKI